MMQELAKFSHFAGRIYTASGSSFPCLLTVLFVIWRALLFQRSDAMAAKARFSSCGRDGN